MSVHICKPQKQKMNNRFRFDEDTHTYYLDGLKIPGYSEIAKATGLVDFSGVRKDILRAASNFGTAVHSMCELWDKGVLNVKKLDPNLKPYLEGYRKFLLKYEPDLYPEWIEQPTYSPKWRFGVTPDRLATIRRKLTTYEIKATASIHKSVAIQTAAQALAIEGRIGVKIKQRMCVRLVPDDFEVKIYNSVMDEAVFVSALNIFNFKNRRN